MTQRLYKRFARVTLTTDGQVYTFPCGDGGFRLTFNADITATSKPNKLGANIYNLPANQRGLFRSGAELVLEAGYVEIFGQVFKGKVLFGHPNRQGPNILTEIDAADGAARDSQAGAFSFAPGTSLQDQISTLLGAVKGDQGFKARIQEKLAASSGQSAFGVITKELEALLAPQGLEVSIQGGVLQITEPNTPTSEPYILLSPGTGLKAARKLEDGRVELVCNLIPGLQPRRGIELDTGALVGNLPSNGVYVLDRTKLQGDTHGAPWLATVEATPIGG